MTTVEILKAGLDIIRDPAKLCRGELAVDAYGATTTPTSDKAVAWCSIGALNKVNAGVFPQRAMRELAYAANSLYGYTTISQVNDRLTHGEIVAMWETAVRNLS